MSIHLLPAPLRRQLDLVIGGFLDQRPASQFIRQTAREQWKLITLNVLSSLGQTFSEGATLGVIYFTVESLAHVSNNTATTWSVNPLLERIPWMGSLLQAVPATLLFSLLMLLALALQALQSFSSYITRVSLQYFSARCRTLVTERIHRQILSLSFPCASRYRVGNLTDYVHQGPAAVVVQIDTVSQVMVGCLMVLMYLLILLRISPWLLLAAAILGLILASIQRRLAPLVRKEASTLVGIEVATTNRIIEDIQGLRLLHSTGQVEQASSRLYADMRNMEHSMRRRARLVEIIEPVSRILPVLAFAAIASISLFIFKDRSSGVLPNLVTFMLALQRLNSRLSGIATCVNSLSENSARLRRLNEILDPSDKQFRRVGGSLFVGLRREIKFEQVGLRYQDDLPPALDRISLTLPRGSTLALVGSSGAGKSSIADLLVGLYAPSSGRILIDGNDLNSIDLSSWQRHLGVVSQDTFLLNASIADNIAFGCPWATRSDVEASATMAQAAGFIADLPEGYDTVIGERGYRLSGGQRQRLSLARAILRNPDLLILDEATSALDSQSERLVQEAIESFDSGHTILVIAHRLSTVMNADQIVVLERGRIVERGTHTELIHLGGRYSDLWTQQSIQSTPSLSPSPHLV